MSASSGKQHRILLYSTDSTLIVMKNFTTDSTDCSATNIYLFLMKGQKQAFFCTLCLTHTVTKKKK